MKKIERVQTGVRMEKKLVKCLKAFAEFNEMSLGDLLEGIVLHSFEGKPPFGEKSIQKINQIKQVYDLTLTAKDSHKLVEE